MFSIIKKIDYNTTTIANDYIVFTNSRISRYGWGDLQAKEFHNS